MSPRISTLNCKIHEGRFSRKPFPDEFRFKLIAGILRIAVQTKSSGWILDLLTVKCGTGVTARQESSWKGFHLRDLENRVSGYGSCRQACLFIDGTVRTT